MSVDARAWAGYIGSKARAQFVLLCAATFLLYLSFSQTTLLAIILAQRGISSSAEARILSAYGLAVVVAAWSLGGLLKRRGVRTAVLLGAVFQVAAYVSYELTLFSPAWAIASRLLHGVGQGLFFASSLLYAQACLSKERMVYLLGMFSMMFPLPYAIGPYLGQLYLDTFGTRHFFVITAVPAIVGLSLLMRLDGISEGLRPASGKSIAIKQMLANHRYVASCFAIFVAGAVFGYITNYMAQTIRAGGGSIAAFFSVFPISLFLFRFFILQKADTLPKYLLGIAALGAMALGFILCFLSTSTAVLAIAGVLYGAGHSVSFPALNAIVTVEYDAEHRHLPVALLNAAFNTGIFVTPVLVFALSPWLSKLQMLPVLAAVCVVAAVVLRVPFAARPAG